MADFFSSEGVQVIVAGAGGAATQAYLRHPGSLVRLAVLVAIGALTAWLFAAWVGRFLSVELAPAGYLVGLFGKVAAEGLLRAVEKVDFTVVLPGKGK